MLGNPIGSKIIFLEETDSTNSYAARLIYDHTPIEGTVILAGFQNAGRGQRGSYWESVRDQNLLVTYILFPSFLAASNHFFLNQALSLSMYEFIKSRTSEVVTIKWPNDILAGNRKIAGLLVENTIRNNQFSYTLVGMGVNINQINFTGFSPEAVSLQLLENKSFDLKTCLYELNQFVEKWYSILRTGNFKKISGEYSDALFGLNLPVEFESNQERFTASIKGVNQNGQLILAGNNGKELIFNNKEVKFIF